MGVFWEDARVSKLSFFIYIHTYDVKGCIIKQSNRNRIEKFEI